MSVLRSATGISRSLRKWSAVIQRRIKPRRATSRDIRIHVRGNDSQNTNRCNVKKNTTTATPTESTVPDSSANPSAAITTDETSATKIRNRASASAKSRFEPTGGLRCGAFQASTIHWNIFARCALSSRLTTSAATRVEVAVGLLRQPLFENEVRHTGSGQRRPHQ